jgi:hypothetical protein
MAQILVIEGTGIGEFEFSPVAADGPVLPSVSRRSSLRRPIHIWTSGNVAYSTTRPEIVRHSLERLQAGQAVVEVLATSKAKFHLEPQEVERLETLLEELIASAQSMFELERE